MHRPINFSLFFDGLATLAEFVCSSQKSDGWFNRITELIRHTPSLNFVPSRIFKQISNPYEIEKEPILILTRWNPFPPKMIGYVCDINEPRTPR